MTPKRVAPEALQSGAGTVMPGVGGMSPPPITRPPKKVGQETCAVCAEGQGMCTCPTVGAMGAPGGAAMAGAKYLGSELLSAPLVAASRSIKVGERGGAEAEPVLTTPGALGTTATLMAAQVSELPFNVYSRISRTTVAQERPPFQPFVGPGGPGLTIAERPRERITEVVEQAKKETEEETLWKPKAPKIKRFLEFWKKYLNISKERGKEVKPEENCQERMLQLIRAVSWVESLHGTGTGNQPKKDPMQSGNPNDTHWKASLNLNEPSSSEKAIAKLKEELKAEKDAAKKTQIESSIKGLEKRVPGERKKESGRVLTGVGRDAHDYSELVEKARAFYDKLPKEDKADFPEDVFNVRSANEGDMQGHRNDNFTEDMSYFWGIMFLVYKTFNPAYFWNDCSWVKLIAGARAYNGGGDPKYEDKIKEALKSMGVDITKK